MADDQDDLANVNNADEQYRRHYEFVPEELPTEVNAPKSGIPDGGDDLLRFEMETLRNDQERLEQTTTDLLRDIGNGIHQYDYKFSDYIQQNPQVPAIRRPFEAFVDDNDIKIYNGFVTIGKQGDEDDEDIKGVDFDRVMSLCDQPYEYLVFSKASGTYYLYHDGGGTLEVKKSDNPDTDLDLTEEGSFRVKLFTYSGGDNIEPEDVFWRGNISFIAGEMESSSSSSIEESSSSFISSSSAPSDESSSEQPPEESSSVQPPEESSSLSGSDKSTAIVKNRLSDDPDAFVALFTMEAPEVLFEDVVIVHENDSTNRIVKIDPQFISVCEDNSIRAISACPVYPSMVGAEVVGEDLIVRCSTKNTGDITVKLTGVRRGFASQRFPSRTRKQYLENEKFLNSAYSK